MKVILKPTVHIVSLPQFFPHPDYPLPADSDDLTKIGAFGAKGCYDAFGVDGRPNYENQKAILGHRHGSVLEHINIGIFIEGITRALTLELNRHRTFAISQRSTRYTKEEDAAIVLDPYYAQLYEKHEFYYSSVEDIWLSDGMGSMTDIFVIQDDEQRLLFNHLSHANRAIKEYQKEVELLMKLNPNNLSGFELRKWARGKARNILPHALETRGLWTNNIRGWRWVIESRSSVHAEPEIRRLVYAIWNKLMNVAPIYFEDFHKGTVVDGIPELTPAYSKV